MKTLHLTNHIGTKRNLENVFQYLKISNKLFTENLNSNNFLYSNKIDYNEINEVWENYKYKIKEYECLFFSDTIMYALPFLKNIDNHNLKIIIYITNRFDFSIQDEKIRLEYAFLLNNYPINQLNTRVIFCSDNKYDQYYASLYGIKFFFSDILRLTPFINEELNLPSNEKLFVFNRGNQIFNYNSFLIRENIDFEIFGPEYKRYKDELEVSSYLGYLHLPYQTNIQSLWENLGFSIIFFVPSKSFMKKLVGLNWYYFEEKFFIDNKKNGSKLLDISIELSEWYQPENSDFFEFFDSWNHLKEIVEEYKNNIEKIKQKKSKIKELLKLSNKINIKKWEKLIMEI